MNPEKSDPSNAVAYLLAILAESTRRQNQVHPASTPVSGRRVDPQVPDAVFAQGEIIDTSAWMVGPTTRWYEPREWALPPQQLSTKSSLPRLPDLKRKRSSSPEPEKAPVPVQSFRSHTHALKYVLRLAESEQFMDALCKIKREQDEIESQLFEERERIIRQHESKRKMNQILHSIGSESTGEKVLSI
jgi:hypothetical protein